MELLALAYSIACFTQLAAGLPQLFEIIREKSSHEMNLFTWGGWLGSQVVCLIYILSLGNLVLAAVSTAWTVYYIAMVLIILYFRHPRFIKPTIPEVVTELS